MIHDVTTPLENTLITSDFDMTIKILHQYNSIIPKGVDIFVSNLDTNTYISDVMKGLTKLNRLLMIMSFGVLNLKIWSYQKDYNRFHN